MPENQIINILGPKVHAIELHANKKNQICKVVSNVKYISICTMCLLFIFTGSSDKEQLTYVLPRIKDLKEVMEANLSIKPILRVFTGDNPARQFESGQRRGGKYSTIHSVLDRTVGFYPPNITISSVVIILNP